MDFSDILEILGMFRQSGTSMGTTRRKPCEIVVRGKTFFERGARQVSNGLEAEDLLATPLPASMRDVSGYLDSLKNFDHLDLGGKASDLDLIVHASNKNHGDRFLVMESKRPGERLGLGQKILLDALRKLPGFTVVVVYGTPSEGFSCTGDWTGTFTTEQLKERVCTWWTEAKA